MYLQLCLRLIFWNYFESIDFNCILLLFLLLVFVVAVVSSIVFLSQRGQFLSCATVAFSVRTPTSAPHNNTRFSLVNHETKTIIKTEWDGMAACKIPTRLRKIQVSRTLVLHNHPRHQINMHDILRATLCAEVRGRTSMVKYVERVGSAAHQVPLYIYTRWFKHDRD
jgi:hypothetical protein